MGQFVNVNGILPLLKQPALLRPHERVRGINEIDFARLRHTLGCRFVVFDKDNTLTLPYDERLVHPSAFASCVETFDSAHVLLFSNTAGSPDDRDYVEAQRLEQLLGIRVLRHKERKPGGGEELLRVTQGEKTVVIGDRLATDIVFGNLNGCHTILVDPIDPSRDNAVVRAVRHLEQFALRAQVYSSP
jgi:phosphatidylglycerophosphatase GEP4